MAKVRMTVRAGSKVEKSDHESVRDAIKALETRFSTIDANRSPQKILSREIAPVDQVVARAQLAASGVRAGIDLRGDGSAEAWSGRWRREIVEQKSGENAYKALRRVLAT